MRSFRYVCLLWIVARKIGLARVAYIVSCTFGTFHTARFGSRKDSLIVATGVVPRQVGFTCCRCFTSRNVCLLFRKGLVVLDSGDKRRPVNGVSVYVVRLHHCLDLVVSSDERFCHRVHRNDSTWYPCGASKLFVCISIPHGRHVALKSPLSCFPVLSDEFEDPL